MASPIHDQRLKTLASVVAESGAPIEEISVNPGHPTASDPASSLANLGQPTSAADSHLISPGLFGSINEMKFLSSIHDLPITLDVPSTTVDPAETLVPPSDVTAAAPSSKPLKVRWFLLHEPSHLLCAFRASQIEEKRNRSRA